MAPQAVIFGLRAGDLQEYYRLKRDFRSTGRTLRFRNKTTSIKYPHMTYIMWGHLLTIRYAILCIIIDGASYHFITVGLTITVISGHNPGKS